MVALRCSFRVESHNRLSATALDKTSVERMDADDHRVRHNRLSATALDKTDLEHVRT